MKKLITSLSAIVLLAFAFASCTTESTPTNPPSSAGGVATNLRVNSLANNRVGVKWTRDTGDHGVDTLIASDASDGSANLSITAAAGDSSAIIAALKLGVTYKFTVHAPGGVSAGIIWAAAIRSGTVRIFETDDPSSSDQSGLCLTPGNVHAEATSVSAGKQDSVDIVLASDATATYGIDLESAGVTGSGIPNPPARGTIFNSTTAFVNGGLDADYYSSNLFGLIPGVDFNDPLSFNDWPFSGSLAGAGTASAIVRVKRFDGTYARIEVLRQPANGNLLYGTNGAGYKYIDVVVSSQVTSNLPYAARGKRSVGTGFAKPHSAGSYQAN